MESPRYTLSELAGLLGVRHIGQDDYALTGLATLASALPGELSFLANSRYRSALQATKAGAVILAPEMVEACPCHCLVSDAPYLTYARASQLFAPMRKCPPGVHASAVVSASAQIDATASVGANCTIEEGVRVGAGTVIGPGCFLGAGTALGSHCLLHANVTCYHGVCVGDRAVIHAGVVIGADGFGFAPAVDFDRQGWVKIEQLGGVRIGDDVEIGAGTTIDRGALDDTVIGDRVIIDNQVQIAHNVEIGANTGIAGCSAIAGSTRIGRNCTIAGAVGIIGHLNITDNVHITAMSLVTKSIDKPGSYSSGTPLMDTRAWRRSAVRFSQLDTMVGRLVDLEDKKS